MPAATADVSNNGSITVQDSGSSSLGEPQRQQQQLGQQAQSERELGSLCSSLQAAAAAANNDLREYLLTHSNQRANVIPLSRELVEIQTAAKVFVRHCSVSAHESSEQTLPSSVLDRLIAVVHQAGKIVADVMNTLESSGSGSISRDQEALSPEQLTARVGNLTATASICTTALNLGLDAMAVGPSLQPAQEDSNTLQPPTYQTTQLLEDTLSLRLRITNLSTEQQTTVPDVAPAISEFLEQLQNQIGQGANSLFVPAIAESIAESRQSRSNSASLVSELPQSNGLLQPNPSDIALSGQQSPAYDSVRIDYPAPSSISMQHLSRKPFFEGEILSVAFVTRNRQTHVTGTTMLAPTRFYPLQGQNPAVTANAAGGLAVFPPEGAELTAWAYVGEDEPVGSSYAGASPWLHDGSDFRKPVLCIGDFATGKRFQKLRQWGIRPLCFSPDGRRLAMTNGRHRIGFLDAAHQFGARTDDGLITAHTDAVTHAMFTPDSHALVSLSRDGTIRLTDPLNMEPLAKLDTGTWKKPTLLGVTPDSNVVVSVWGDLVYRWNHASGAVDSFALGSRRGRGGEGWPVALSPDCRFLLCRNDEGADVSDAHSGEVLFSVRFNKGFLTAAAFTKDGRHVALAKASTCVGTKVHQSTLDVWQIDF